VLVAPGGAGHSPGLDLLAWGFQVDVEWTGRDSTRFVKPAAA
jgi:hypothetical protein